MAPILTGPLVAAATIIKGVEVVSGSIADARIALHWDHTQITLFHKTSRLKGLSEKAHIILQEGLAQSDIHEYTDDLQSELLHITEQLKSAIKLLPSQDLAPGTGDAAIDLATDAEAITLCSTASTMIRSRLAFAGVSSASRGTALTIDTWLSNTTRKSHRWPGQLMSMAKASGTTLLAGLNGDPGMKRTEQEKVTEQLDKSILYLTKVRDYWVNGTWTQNPLL